MKKLLSALSLLVAVFTMFTTPVLAGATVSPEAEAHILSELRRVRTPNAAIAVIQDGETSFVFEDSNPYMLFQIGSVTKSFTGFAVLLLEDMGLLSVTDPVSYRLPWFDVSYSGMPVPREDITVANLLHHTSGFTSNEGRFPSSITELTPDEFIAQLSGIELAFYPSTNHIYGNINYIILGILVEAVSGQSYDDFMTQYVLHPLGMYNTFACVQRAHATGRGVGGNRLGFLHVWPWNPPVMPHAVPTGYIYSNIYDMARWAGIHLGTVEISEQVTRVVQRSHRHFHGSANPFAGRGYLYGAGWVVNAADGSVSHGGMTPGYSATVRMLRHYNAAVVVLCNLSSLDTMPFYFGGFVLDAVVHGAFNRVDTGLFVYLDIALTILTAVGVVFLGLLVRLIVKAVKRLRSGEAIKPNFTLANLIRAIGPIIAIAVAVVLYVVPPIMFDNSYAFLLLFSPASMLAGGIALWVIVVYCFFAWLVRVFVGLHAKG